MAKATKAPKAMKPMKAMGKATKAMAKAMQAMAKAMKAMARCKKEVKAMAVSGRPALPGEQGRIAVLWHGCGKWAQWIRYRGWVTRQRYERLRLAERWSNLPPFDVHFAAGTAPR
jgi:hypothetical protein